MELKFRVKNLEGFKDGNVLGGRFLQNNEILVVTEREKNQILQSGGKLEVIEMVIDNPLKKEDAVEEEPKSGKRGKG